MNKNSTKKNSASEIYSCSYSQFVDDKNVGNCTMSVWM